MRGETVYFSESVIIFTSNLGASEVSSNGSNEEVAEEFIKIVKNYFDNEIKRPEFLRMIENSKKKNFDYVLVYQLDRFARNRYDSANYKAKLKKNGVRVLSAKENISEDASGILIEGVLESMAEYYSAELSQKVKRGIRESYEKGYFIGGYGLFGYDIVDKKWTINSYEADIVRDIFTRYKNGEKAKEIIARLNGQGIKTKAGSSFNMNSLARIIRNEKYIAKVTSHGTVYTNVIPPIVDEELFYECNVIMDKHKHKPRNSKSEQPYILSGKLFCGFCGSLMTAETGTSHTGKLHHYYKCFGRKRNKHSCKKANYRQQDLEDLVFGTTVKYVLQPDVIQTVAEQVVSKFNSEIKKTANRVILYDDKILIFYNTDDNHPTVIKRKDTEELISHLNDIASNCKTATNDCPNTTGNNSHIVQKENSLEPQGFKRVSLGGEIGI